MNSTTWPLTSMGLDGTSESGDPVGKTCSITITTATMGEEEMIIKADVASPVLPYQSERLMQPLRVVTLEHALYSLR